MKEELAVAIYKIVEKLGGKSDVLCPIGNMIGISTEEESIEELNEWLNIMENKTSSEVMIDNILCRTDTFMMGLTKKQHKDFIKRIKIENTSLLSS